MRSICFLHCDSQHNSVVMQPIIASTSSPTGPKGTVISFGVFHTSSFNSGCKRLGYASVHNWRKWFSLPLASGATSVSLETVSRFSDGVRKALQHCFRMVLPFYGRLFLAKKLGPFASRKALSRIVAALMSPAALLSCKI